MKSKSPILDKAMASLKRDGLLPRPPRCMRCRSRARETVFTIYGGEEKLCKGCAKAVRHDGQELRVLVDGEPGTVIGSPRRDAYTVKLDSGQCVDRMESTIQKAARCHKCRGKGKLHHLGTTELHTCSTCDGTGITDGFQRGINPYPHP